MKRETINSITFVDYFIKKERNFLIRLNTKAFYDTDFKFYIGWFIYAINDYMQKEYDIEKEFIYFFSNNFSLNIIFFIYIMNSDFRKKVMSDIIEYKKIYGKEYIYD